MDPTTLLLMTFFSWNRFLFKNSIRSSQTLKFKFQIVQTELDGELTKIKVLHLDEFYSIGIGDFSIWNHSNLKFCSKSSNFEI
jgi:hypothetical protein